MSDVGYYYEGFYQSYFFPVVTCVYVTLPVIKGRSKMKMDFCLFLTW